MPTFFNSWSPYGPSGAVEADNLDAACTLVHACIEAMGMSITARHLPPLIDNGTFYSEDWQGAVLVVRSPVQRYGDNAQLRVAIYEQGQTSYHDHCRRKLEAGNAQV